MRIAMHKVNGVYAVTKSGITFTPDVIRFGELPNGGECINMYASFDQGNVFIGWIPIFSNEEIWTRHLC